MKIKQYDRKSVVKYATHSFNAFGKQISKYNFEKVRFVHIDGVRT